MVDRFEAFDFFSDSSSKSEMSDRLIEVGLSGLTGVDVRGGSAASTAFSSGVAAGSGGSCFELFRDEADFFELFREPDFELFGDEILLPSSSPSDTCTLEEATMDALRPSESGFGGVGSEKWSLLSLDVPDLAEVECSAEMVAVSVSEEAMEDSLEEDDLSSSSSSCSS